MWHFKTCRLRGIRKFRTFKFFRSFNDRNAIVIESRFLKKKKKSTWSESRVHLICIKYTKYFSGKSARMEFQSLFTFAAMDITWSFRAVRTGAFDNRRRRSLYVSKSIQLQDIDMDTWIIRIRNLVILADYFNCPFIYFFIIFLLFYARRVCARVRFFPMQLLYFFLISIEMVYNSGTEFWGIFIIAILYRIFSKLTKADSCSKSPSKVCVINL